MAACLAIVASANGLWLSQLEARRQLCLVALAVRLPIVLVAPLLNPPNKIIGDLDESIVGLHSAVDSGTTVYHEFLPRVANLDALPPPNRRLMADYADGYPVDKLNRSLLPVGAQAELTLHSPQDFEWRIKSDEAFSAEIYNF